ncbi:methyltransferase family protein [Granulicella arctica]|uniref:methyltransferase family protein n=1 Tax=Granulicella arctica TaxID=940613 RepID=UPI0021DFB14B|nr:isoprenylcysteine carboxylmethyltransferase family protein [Granulicella arctica]
MKATAVEYRFRHLIHGLIFVLGFIAPWNYAVHLDARGPNAHLWGVLAALLAKSGVTSIGTAFEGLLVLGIVLALLGAWVRTWGAAYLSSAVVHDGGMHGEGMVADGPYRYVRNPLYLGTFLHALAVALLMPVSGAIFTVVLIGMVQVRLTLREEPFLQQKLGASYAAYCALVPRLMPSLRPRVAASGQRAAWGQAVLGEVYFWGVAGSFAVAGWWYNAMLLIRCVIVSYGVSMVGRAFVVKK